MDARVRSASTRVFDALLPAHDAESFDSHHHLAFFGDGVLNAHRGVAEQHLVVGAAEGIIGKQFSLGSTTQSKITGC